MFANLNYNFIITSLITIGIIFAILYIRKFQTRLTRHITFTSGFTLFLYLIFFTSGNQLATFFPNMGTDFLKIFITISLTLTYYIYWLVVEFLIMTLIIDRQGFFIPQVVQFVSHFIAFFFIGLSMIYLNLEVNLIDSPVVGSTMLAALASIGFAMKDILTELLTGIGFQMGIKFTEGDWIRVGEYEGQVLKINLTNVILKTLDYNHVAVSNTYITNAGLLNYSRPDNIEWQKIEFRSEYDIPPHMIEEAVYDSVRRTPEILPDPAVEVFVTGYADEFIEYEVRYATYVDKVRQKVLRHDILKQIWYALKRAEVPMDEPASKIEFIQRPSPEEVWHSDQIEITALWSQSEFTKGLTPAQIAQISKASKIVQYARNEYLVNQDEAGDWLFIIQRGEVGIYYNQEDGKEIFIDRHGAGQFFGEMSLLTGDPRSASIRAETDVEVVILGKETFANVLLKDPDILEVLLDTLENRRQGLSEKIDEASRSFGRSALASRIKHYLGLQ